MNKNIPFQDLVSQNKEVKRKLVKAFKESLSTGIFVSNKKVEDFEKSYSNFVKSRYTVGCSSGTSALRLALKSINIKPGDKVIVPALTFVATIEAIVSIGATPVLIDVDSKTWNLDTSKLTEKLVVNAKAIIPVHLHGRLADMQRLLEISNHYEVPIIEDAAQSHGASRNGFHSGSSGLLAAHSFYPGKNLGALGEGGAVSTNDKILAEKMKLLRNWGSTQKYWHDNEGSNERMDEIQAAFLKIRLEKLDDWTDKRRINAKYYDELLDELNIVRPISDTGKHVYHIYAIRVENRDEVIKKLSENKISTGIHYPYPVHFQPAYKRYLEIGTDLQISEQICSEFISLPNWENMERSQIEYVVKNLEKAVYV